MQTVGLWTQSHWVQIVRTVRQTISCLFAVFFSVRFFPSLFTFGVSRNTILLFSMIYSPRQWLHCVSYCIRRCVYDRTRHIYKRRRCVDTIYNTDDLIFITSSDGPNNSITSRSTLLIIHCRMTSHGTLRWLVKIYSRVASVVIEWPVDAENQGRVMCKNVGRFTPTLRFLWVFGSTVRPHSPLRRRNRLFVVERLEQR